MPTTLGPFSRCQSHRRLYVALFGSPTTRGPCSDRLAATATGHAPTPFLQSHNVQTVQSSPVPQRSDRATLGSQCSGRAAIVRPSRSGSLGGRARHDGSAPSAANNSSPTPTLTRTPLEHQTPGPPRSERPFRPQPTNATNKTHPRHATQARARPVCEVGRAAGLAEGPRLLLCHCGAHLPAGAGSAQNLVLVWFEI